MNTMQLTETIGDITAKDYRNTDACKHVPIHFCCDDNKTLKEASQEAGVDAQQLNRALEQITVMKTTSLQEFNKWNLDFLIDYIINTHHQYAKENAVIIYDLAQKVAYHHGKNHPELTKLATAMFLFLHDLLNHMMKEEQILFPNIRQLVKDKSRPGRGMYTTFGLIKEWVTLLQKEHQATGKDLKLFHELTNDYLLPEDACSSYKYLFEKLKEFEDNLLLHVHLENNILFPKALAEDEVIDEIEFVNINTKNNGYAKKANQTE
jgi:regulator of cell morphogenesis and NO signaling